MSTENEKGLLGAKNNLHGLSLLGEERASGRAVDGGTRHPRNHASCAMSGGFPEVLHSSRLTPGGESHRGPVSGDCQLSHEQVPEPHAARSADITGVWRAARRWNLEPRRGPQARRKSDLHDGGLPPSLRDRVEQMVPGDRTPYCGRGLGRQDVLA